MRVSNTWIIAGAIALMVGIFGIGRYTAGGKSVELHAMQDSLHNAKSSLAIVAKQRDSIFKVIKEQDAKTDQTRTVYLRTKSNVTTRGDTIQVKGIRRLVDADIANRINSDDAHVKSLESELASAKFAFRVDTVFIAHTDTVYKLQEKVTELKSYGRFGHGIHVGVGACMGPSGIVPCVYGGYGIDVRL